MKASIFEIKRFAVHDGDGIRTTVFFKGCPLKCVWCHNPEGLSSEKQLAYNELKCTHCAVCAAVCKSDAVRFFDGKRVFFSSNCVKFFECVKNCPTGALKAYGKDYTVEELLPILLEDRDFFDESQGGVTLSGGECLLYSDFCQKLLMILKKEGINTAVDTCGFVSRQSFEKVIDYTDVFLYDVKAVDEGTHIRCTGQSNALILENLFFVDSLGKKIEVRIPYVPEYNDGEMPKIAQLLKSLKNLTGVRILPYHNFAESKYLSLGIDNTLPKRLPAVSEIDNVKKIFQENSIIVK